MEQTLIVSVDEAHRLNVGLALDYVNLSKLLATVTDKDRLRHLEGMRQTNMALTERVHAILDTQD